MKKKNEGADPKAPAPKLPGPPTPVEINAETITAMLSEHDDFGFEMRVRALLEKQGARVQHGWTYLDPNLGKLRQFDLRCELYHWTDACRIRLALECKNISRESPVVVSGALRTKAESFHHVVRSVAPDGTSPASVMTTDDSSWTYGVNRFVGKSLIGIKRNPQENRLVPAAGRESDIYERWNQALSSADELCKGAVRVETLSGQLLPRARLISTLILPGFVIPDGRLWQVQYGATGEIEKGPEAVEGTTVFVNHKVTVIPQNLWMRISHVHFWTFTGLQNFLAGLTQPGTYWDDRFGHGMTAYQPPVE